MRPHPYFGLALFALLLSLPLAAQDKAPVRRLILKDGSYQLVTKYEVKGNRVRYYSSEREEWEELPDSLVDWTATNKYENERAASASSPEAVQLDKELEHESEKAEAALPLVAPGLRLPEDTGVFLLDNFQGEPQILEIQQSAGDINRNTKTNIFRGAVNPIAGLKVTIELEGAHAKIQAHVEVPSLYIKPEDNQTDQSAQSATRVDSTRAKTSQPQQPQQPQQPEGPMVPFDRFRIVKVEVKGGKRIVGDVKRQVTGKVSQEQHWVKTTITNVTGGWLKLTPAESLAPGEYALVEMMGKEGMNLYLWDFGVNPKAPANPNPWKPDAHTPAPQPDVHPR
ncbi:MAG TPA: hypothetical protein VFO46_01745 [Candidatus Sulfotelmatobacter sp.]|nr:hypothetical protein [Candidatus Sulfotelmatobacter sp.]